MRKVYLLTKQEISLRKKALFFWVTAWSLMTLLFASLFESFQESFSENNPFADFEDNPFFAAFGVDSDYFATVESFFSGEYLISFLLISAIFATYLGADTISGKIEDKTISNLLTKNITRTQIYFSKVLGLTIYLILGTIILGLVNYSAFIVFTEQDEISVKFFTVAFLAVFLLQYLMLFFGITIGLFFGKGRALVSGIAVAIFTWLLDVLSKIDGFPDILQYISPYYYINVEQITAESRLDGVKILVIVFVTVLLGLIGWIKFKEKDIQV